MVAHLENEAAKQQEGTPGLSTEAGSKEQSRQGSQEGDGEDEEEEAEEEEEDDEEDVSCGLFHLQIKHKPPFRISKL